ncbi:MAG: DUF4394 domain-containing protein, partial [Haliea sp.]
SLPAQRTYATAPTAVQQSATPSTPTEQPSSNAGLLHITKSKIRHHPSNPNARPPPPSHASITRLLGVRFSRPVPGAQEWITSTYSYNKANPRITTNYALDAATGTLVTQGTREGMTPAVSPNTGQLFTVGSLKMPFTTAAFDIQALSDVAFASLNSSGGGASRWVTIDLQTGAARSLGTIGGGEAVRAIALEP